MHGVGFPTPVGPIAPKTAQTPTTAVTATQTAAKEEEPDFFSFDTLLDIVNPLQHLPIVGTLYRAITGDKMHVGAKLAGDGLYGGPMGLLSSVADVLFEKITGKNFGDTVLAFLTGEDGPQSEPAVNVAEKKPAPSLPQPQISMETSLDATLFPGIGALDAAMAARGYEADIALRARQAYARSLNMTAAQSAGVTS